MKSNLLEILRGQKSQMEMATVYGVSQQAWSKWEKGYTVPENGTMLQMERDFKIPMEIIFFKSFNYKMELKESVKVSC